ncbi:MAG: GGDEF domain-containing protein [Thermodesulfobacteriota bacterium]
MDNCALHQEVQRLREECQRLLELSQTDPLTGLYNRSYFFKALAKEMERTRRTGFPTGLIMIDLDHFSKVNKTHGHQAGDAVLGAVSRLFEKNIRKLDIPCRYGGEEFAIILPGTRLPQAVALAQRLRTTLAQFLFNLEGGLALSITGSFGVDCYAAKDEVSIKGFIRRTDRFLLEAKTRGRNLVRHRQSEPAAVPSGVTVAERSELFPEDQVYAKSLAQKR